MRSAKEVAKRISDEFWVDMCGSDTCDAIVSWEQDKVAQVVAAIRAEMIAELRKMAEACDLPIHMALRGHVSIVPTALRDAADRLEALVREGGE